MPLHARRAARIRSVIRCRASSTPGLTEENGVKDAERLPDLGPAARRQGRGAVAVHLPGPARQSGNGRFADVLPYLRDVLVQARRIEQVGHRFGGRRRAMQARPDRRDVQERGIARRVGPAGNHVGAADMIVDAPDPVPSGTPDAYGAAERSVRPDAVAYRFAVTVALLAPRRAHGTQAADGR